MCCSQSRESKLTLYYRLSWAGRRQRGTSQVNGLLRIGLRADVDRESAFWLLHLALRFSIPKFTTKVVMIAVAFQSMCPFFDQETATRLHLDRTNTVLRQEPGMVESH